MIGHTTGRQPDIISSCCECLKSLKCSDLCYILLLDCWTSIHRHSTANIRIYWGYWGMSPWVLGMRSKTWTRCTCCLQKRCLHQKAHLLGVPNGHEDLKQGPWFAWFAWLGTSMRQVRWIARNLQGAALWSPLGFPLGSLGPPWIPEAIGANLNQSWAQARCTSCQDPGPQVAQSSEPRMPWPRLSLDMCHNRHRIEMSHLIRSLQHD